MLPMAFRSDLQGCRVNDDNIWCAAGAAGRYGCFFAAGLQEGAASKGGERGEGGEKIACGGNNG